MALIKSVRGFTPKIGKDCFIAENATLVGDVTMGDECSIWFSTVLRGDVNTITIGDRVNIQDGSVLHTLYQKSVIEIGNDVSVGHNVTIHGAKVCDYALIGMGSVLLDGVEVGEGAIVAAGSVVSPGTKIGAHELWMGVPAKFKKMVDPAQAKEMNVKIAHNYLMYSKWYEGRQIANSPYSYGADRHDVDSAPFLFSGFIIELFLYKRDAGSSVGGCDNDDVVACRQMRNVDRVGV